VLECPEEIETDHQQAEARVQAEDGAQEEVKRVVDVWAATSREPAPVGNAFAPVAEHGNPIRQGFPVTI